MSIPKMVEAEIRNGHISREGMMHLGDAYAYGTAPSCAWLESVLISIRVRISMGGSIVIKHNDISLILDGFDAFDEWRKENFPLIKL